MMAKTVVGFYDHASQAKAAVRDLVDLGFHESKINFVASAAVEEAEVRPYFDDEGYYRSSDELTSSGGAAGAGIGATIGGLGGLLMGLGLLAVPGVGPALAAGPIASSLVGAGTGAALGGLTGALVNNDVPEEHASYYAEGVRRGGAVVLLVVDDAEAADTERIMSAHDPVDIEARASGWRDLGWNSYNPNADPYSA